MPATRHFMSNYTTTVVHIRLHITAKITIIITGDLVYHFMECLPLWKVLYMYATVKRCVLSFVFNFPKLISSLMLPGNVFHMFGP